MVKDGNSTMLYKNGKKIHPKEVTEFYGCKMTDEQKKLLEIAKSTYFDALPSVLPSDIEKQLLDRFGFTEDGINAENQLKIFSFMGWLKSQLKPGYPKEFVLNILSNINEGYYRPEHIDELFQLWQTEVNGR